MVFAPTYRHLEQLYNTMLDGSVGSLVAIDVLHSSVDIEDCLRTMSAVASSSNRSKRKLLLASAIADSSVTIPGVSVVIDLCRSLEVKWDRSSRNHVAKTVWASKSICDQRKGRTGRTCPGSVYRMVSKGFYINRLDMWDRPQLTVPSRLFRLLLRCRSAPPPTLPPIFYFLSRSTPSIFRLDPLLSNSDPSFRHLSSAFHSPLYFPYHH